MESSPAPAPVSLGQIVRLALPVGTKIRPANAESRNRQIEWAVVVGVPLRREAMVEGGDLVYCAVRSDDPQWVEAVDQLIAAGAGAIGVNVTPPPAMLKKADAADVPVVVLPEGANLREVHRATLTLITNRQAHVAQRGRRDRFIAHVVHEDDVLRLFERLRDGNARVVQPLQRVELVSEPRGVLQFAAKAAVQLQRAGLAPFDVRGLAVRA